MPVDFPGWWLAAALGLGLAAVVLKALPLRKR
jgi:hypothetical protein